MRTARTFQVIHIVAKSGAYEAQELPPYQPRHLPPAAVTGWKSPVPYLFGGLAAMLGLIAFALLILACSYWKLSGYLDSGENAGEDGGDDDGKVGSGKAAATVFPNSVLVIMAGEEKPTFLATPASGRMCSCSSSSGSGSGSSSGNSSDTNDDEEEKGHKAVELTTTTTTTTTIPPPQEDKR